MEEKGMDAVVAQVAQQVLPRIEPLAAEVGVSMPSVLPGGGQSIADATSATAEPSGELEQALGSLSDMVVEALCNPGEAASQPGMIDMVGMDEVDSSQRRSSKLQSSQLRIRGLQLSDFDSSVEAYLSLNASNSKTSVRWNMLGAGGVTSGGPRAAFLALAGSEPDRYDSLFGAGSSGVGPEDSHDTSQSDTTAATGDGQFGDGSGPRTAYGSRNPAQWDNVLDADSLPLAASTWNFRVDHDDQSKAYITAAPALVAPAVVAVSAALMVLLASQVQRPRRANTARLAANNMLAWFKAARPDK